MEKFGAGKDLRVHYSFTLQTFSELLWVCDGFTDEQMRSLPLKEFRVEKGDRCANKRLKSVKCFTEGACEM